MITMAQTRKEIQHDRMIIDGVIVVIGCVKSIVY
jgi:hypothetical protein